MESKSPALPLGDGASVENSIAYFSNFHKSRRAVPPKFSEPGRQIPSLPGSHRYDILMLQFFPVQRTAQKGACLMVHHLVIGVIFLVWGIADVLRVRLPGILARRLEASSEEGRRLWQRLLGVLELIVGGGQLLFYFFSDNQTVTNIILAVMILAAVCILGPYYHWRKQEKENTQE